MRVREKSIKAMDFFDFCDIIGVPDFREDVKWFLKIIIKY